MARNTWRGLCAALAALLLLQFYTRFLSTQQRASFYGRYNVWSWAPHRDTGNIALTSSQCDEAFPDLYYEIDRAEAYWKIKQHTITKQNIDVSQRTDAAFTVLLYDNQISVTANTSIWMIGGWRKRTIYILTQLQRAAWGATVAGETLPCVEFSITVGDMADVPTDGTHTIAAFTRRFDSAEQELVWLIPDFNFFASPLDGGSWQQMQRRAASYDSKIADKIQKVLWRGVTWTNEELRGSLLKSSRGKDWADVEVVDWKERTHNMMEMDDFCRYIFLVHTEGRSYSGRLNYLLNCNSLSIVHNLEWTTIFYHLLKDSGPDQNYIRVKRDFSDLEEIVEQYSQDSVKAQLVAENAVSTFRDRYTSPAAEACYWRRMIESYSHVAYKPDPFDAVSVPVPGVQATKMRLRGTPFEEAFADRGPNVISD